MNTSVEANKPDSPKRLSRRAFLRGAAISGAVIAGEAYIPSIIPGLPSDSANVAPEFIAALSTFVKRWSARAPVAPEAQDVMAAAPATPFLELSSGFESEEYCDPEGRYCRTEHRVGLIDEMLQYYPLGADYSRFEVYPHSVIRIPAVKIHVAYGMNGDPHAEFDDRVHDSWNNEAGVFDPEEFGRWVTPPIIELDNICSNYQMFDSSYTSRIILDNIDHYGQTSPRYVPIRCLGAEPVVELDSEKLKHPGTSAVSFLDSISIATHERLHEYMMVHGIDREPRGIEMYADSFSIEHIQALFPSNWREALDEYMTLRKEVDAILFFDYHSLALRRAEIFTAIPEGEWGHQHATSLPPYLFRTSGTSWRQFLERLNNLTCTPLGRNDRSAELFENLSFPNIFGNYLAHAFYPQGSGHHDDLFDPIRGEKLEANTTVLGADQPQTIQPNHFGYYELDAINPDTHIAVDPLRHEAAVITTIDSRAFPVRLPINEALKPPLPNPQALPVAVYNASPDDELTFMVRYTTPPNQPSVFMPAAYNELGMEATFEAEAAQSHLDAATLAQHFNKLAEAAQDTNRQEQKRREFKAFAEEHKWLHHRH